MKTLLPLLLIIAFISCTNSGVKKPLPVMTKEEKTEWRKADSCFTYHDSIRCIIHGDTSTIPMQGYWPGYYPKYVHNRRTNKWAVRTSQRSNYYAFSNAPIPEPSYFYYGKCPIGKDCKEGQEYAFKDSATAVKSYNNYLKSVDRKNKYFATKHTYQ